MRIEVRSTSGGRSRKRFVDAAQQDDRPFDEAGDLGEQGLVFDDFEALGEGELGGVVPDRLGALGGVEHDEGALELGGVVLEAGDLERGGSHEAVAAACRSPAAMPSIAKGTISAPASVVSRQRIECSGRTQRSEPAPQRMDFGQGKARTVASTVSATISAAGRPGLQGDGEPDLRAFLSSRYFELVPVRPVEAQETCERGVGGVDARALAFLAQPAGVVGQAFQRQRQAAGGAKAAAWA